MKRIFEPLDDNVAEQITNVSNQVLHEIKGVTPDGIKTIELKPIQVQAVFKAMFLYNLIADKLRRSK